MKKRIIALMLLGTLCLTGCSAQEIGSTIIGENKSGKPAPSKSGRIASEIMESNDGIISVEVKDSQQAILFLPGNPQTIQVKLAGADAGSLTDIIMDVYQKDVNWADDNALYEFYMNAGKKDEKIFEFVKGTILTEDMVTEKLAETLNGQ